MVTLEELANKGRRKLQTKLDTMKQNYASAKDIAVENYEALPFGPTRKANYRKAWEYMVSNYQSKMTPDIVEKWARNWTKKMSI